MKLKRLHDITERHVQAIWYDRDLRPEGLSTDDGISVRVVHPGEWNQTAGPDFTNAVLEIGTERRRLVGDVEVHLSPSDWDAHGHGRDPAYRNVVAHVTWRGGRPPLTLPEGILSIRLGRFLESDLGFSPDSIDVQAYPFDKMPSDARPCRRRAAADPDHVRRVLSNAGTWRLVAKAQRLRSLLKTENPRQAFYSEVMGALGYGGNGAGFRAVATAVPYAVVAAEPDNVESAFLTAASFVNWNRGQVRPNNLPEVRLKAAARLFLETRVMALAAADNLSVRSCREMVTALTYGGLVGRGRAAAIVANVVVPFALACERVHDMPTWLPPEDVSVPVRRVACRMFGGDHNPRAWYATNGLYIQGLIQIDREWCTRLHPECVGCITEAA